MRDRLGQARPGSSRRPRHRRAAAAAAADHRRRLADDLARVQPALLERLVEVDHELRACRRRATPTITAAGACFAFSRSETSSGSPLVHLDHEHVDVAGLRLARDREIGLRGRGFAGAFFASLRAPPSSARSSSASRAALVQQRVRLAAT